MNKAFLTWYQQFGLMSDGYFLDGATEHNGVERIAHRAYQRGLKKGKELGKKKERQRWRFREILIASGSTMGGIEEDNRDREIEINYS